MFLLKLYTIQRFLLRKHHGIILHIVHTQNTKHISPSVLNIHDEFPKIRIHFSCSYFPTYVYLQRLLMKAVFIHVIFNGKRYDISFITKFLNSDLLYFFVVLVSLFLFVYYNNVPSIFLLSSSYNQTNEAISLFSQFV